MKETDLYNPIKKYFSLLGYIVKAEVKNCDVVAIKENEIIIIELKKSFSLKLVYQCMERQKLSNNVFLAIPKPTKIIRKNHNNMVALCKALGLGIIFVEIESKQVQVILTPLVKTTNKNKKKKQLLIKEATSRTFDLNVGGSTKVKLITSFKEKNIKIACILKKEGFMSSKNLIQIYECEKDTYSILYKNFYGWFKRIDRGLYSITNKGLEELKNKEFVQLVEYYNAKYGF